MRQYNSNFTLDQGFCQTFETHTINSQLISAKKCKINVLCRRQHGVIFTKPLQDGIELIKKSAIPVDNECQPAYPRRAGFWKGLLISALLQKSLASYSMGFESNYSSGFINSIGISLIYESE